MAKPRGKRPRIVILGTGFAAMKAAQALAGRAELTVVAPDERFTFRPLVHELISEESRPADIVRPPRLASATYLRDAATRIEANEVVLASGRRAPFDQLLVAIGAEPHFFGVPGAAEHALPVWTLRNALAANLRIKQLLLDAPIVDRPARIVVVGAGATGLEVATEAAALCARYRLPYHVTVLEMRDTIFPDMGPAFRKEVLKGLGRWDLELMLGAKVARVEKDHLLVARGAGAPRHVPSDLTLWCAGVRGRVLEPLSMRVDDTMRSAERPNVWIAGDCARFATPVPQLAQTAEQQGELVARNMLDPEAARAYRPSLRGTILSLGPNYAVAQTGAGRVMAGALAWHVKKQYYKWTLRGP